MSKQLSEKQLVKKYQRIMFWLGLLKIPMLRFARPKLLKINDEELILKIKLKRRTKNHLRSMYFGALCVGADIGAGILTFYHADKKKAKMSFAFKSMSAQFLKRAETDIRFVCSEGKKLEEMIDTSISTGERQNREVKVDCLNESNEIVATFMMEASAKIKKK